MICSPSYFFCMWQSPSKGGTHLSWWNWCKWQMTTDRWHEKSGKWHVSPSNWHTKSVTWQKWGAQKMAIGKSNYWGGIPPVAAHLCCRVETIAGLTGLLHRTLQHQLSHCCPRHQQCHHLSISSIMVLVSLERSWRALSSLKIGPNKAGLIRQFSYLLRIF